MMFWSLRKHIAALLAFALFLPASAAEQQAKPSLYGHINELGSVIVSSGMIPQSTQFPCPVLKVRTGSPAQYAGIEPNDEILECEVHENHIKAKMKRKGKVFLVSLRAKTDKTTPKLALKTGVKAQNLWDLLKIYDVAFVIDRSGSMFNPLAATGKNRWDWIKEQVPTFCDQAQSRAGNKFTLCTFNTEHQLYSDLSATEVRNILTKTVTTGDTSLAPAIRDVLEEHTSRAGTKPFLLIVITDGQTLSSRENANVFLNFQQSMNSKRDFQVVCIQAGQSREGSEFITGLQRDCAARGMSNFVHSLLFEQVSQDGIAPFLNRVLTRS